ncbi:MAG: cytosine deaminase [Rhizobiaceae bacterium]|nr:cytosine deaminase [Rhizobiaceae bacterium]
MSQARLIVANASLPTSVSGDARSGAVERVDITIDGGTIESIGPAGSATREGAEVRDMDSGLVLPAFVDVHTHLDKGHIWSRKANPDGTWMGALMSVLEDRESNWSARDVARRMDFALRCAYAHGTAAIRTHLDSAPPQYGVTWDVFEEARANWAGRIELQGVSLLGPDHLLDRQAAREVAKRCAAASGVFGGAIAEFPEARKAVFAAVEAAGEHGLDLDLHCDETANPEAQSLRHLADAVIETGFKGGVAAGHCCSLANQDRATQRATIDRVVEAGIAVISLPMCNMYLQDRHSAGGARTPRWRGVTPLNELRRAGVPVAIASDNTRDPFYAYGDLDGLEVLREGARILQFDHPAEDAWSWACSVGRSPASFAGFAYQAVIRDGSPADLVLFRARNWTELLARPQSDRVVLRGGVAIDRTLPDYRELDDLMGQA